MITIRGVALGEVLGHQFPALGAEEVRAAHVEDEGEQPDRALGEAVEE
jgi:arginyl-tRNA synthetase